MSANAQPALKDVLGPCPAIRRALACGFLGVQCTHPGRACFLNEPDLYLVCVCWVPASHSLSSLDVLSLPHAFSYAVRAWACGRLCECLCVCVCARVRARLCVFKDEALGLGPVSCLQKGLRGCVWSPAGLTGSTERSGACLRLCVSTDSSVLVKGLWR